MENKILVRKILVVLLALVGFVTSIKLAIIYYEVNYDAYALPSFCSINDYIDCDGVAKTTHSQFFGIPLAYWGIFLYVFMIFLVFADKIKQIKISGKEIFNFLEVFKNPLAYIASLGYIAFVISMTLASVSIFEIKKICVLCFFTYFLNLLIAAVATLPEEGIYGSFKTSVLDFIDAVKIKKYLISLICVAVTASVFLTYTGTSYVFAPQVKRFKEFKKYEKLQADNPYRVSGNIMGDEKAKTIVYIYTDYRCPICRVFNVMLSRAANELKGIKFEHKNLPLDIECNKYLPKPMHQGSCMMAKYAIAAENQGRFWDFNSELFEKQPKTEEDVIKLAESMGLDAKKLEADAKSPQTTERLLSEIDDSREKKIDGTPALVINGKVINGIKPYYELKDILIKAGASEK